LILQKFIMESIVYFFNLKNNNQTESYKKVFLFLALKPGMHNSNFMAGQKKCC